MYSQSTYLSILTHAPAESVKLFAESIMDHLGEITVLSNRVGLVMLPYTDTAHGTQFYLGEVLIAEARVQIAGGGEGYAAVMGHDLVQALGIALLDAALQANLETEKIAAFLHEHEQLQKAADEALLRAVESTRAEMETF